MAEEKKENRRPSGLHGKPGDFHSRQDGQKPGGFRGKPGEGKPSGFRGKPGEGKPNGFRGKPGEGKPAGFHGKPGEGKPNGFRGKPGEGKPNGFRGKPGEGKPAGFHGKPGTGKPSDRRPAGFQNRPAPQEKPGYQDYEYKKKPRQVEGLPSRRSALNVIRAVTEKGTWASVALDRELKQAGLNPKDRRLAARLAYDTLDRLYYLDYVLDQVMAKPDTDIRLRNILRLGACQLLLEDHIPEMAATDTAVELCTELGLEGLKGVCNGILRNLIRRKEEIELPSAQEDPVRALSIELSAPVFLVRLLIDNYGLDGARQLLSATGRDSNITIRPNLLRLTHAAFEKLLEKKVWEVEKGEMPDSWIVKNAANIGEDTDFLSGNFSIQSEQSQIACLAASPKRGNLVLDCCAAPGGKACYMAELMDGTGRVQAWELYGHRTDLIEAQVKRLGLENVRPMQRDATVFRPDLTESFDVVLLDAPCTGTGEMHNKPDSKYRLKEDSLPAMVKTQHDLLEAVSAYVRPGGILVYSTCSVLRDENAGQMEAFLRNHPEFTLQPLPEIVPERIRNMYDMGVQLLPGVNASAGFYICRLRKRGLV